MGLDPLKILWIAAGLGMVIFVHELGHFLVARMAGVLVERFSIGFGPVIFSVKRGETEYAMSLIPLGGYVKMLGQTDTPEVEEKVDDVRSYQNKSVGWRIAIISAGVVMNVIFAFVCFAVAYRMGVSYLPAGVGSTVPGLPAWKAGIRSGDDIVQVANREWTDYETLMIETAITHPPHDTVHLLVDRDGKQTQYDLAPVQDDLKPVIGVRLNLGLELFRSFPTLPGTPAAHAKDPGFESEDKVLSIDGVPVSTHRELINQLYAKQTQSVVVKVQRKPDDPAASANTADVKVEPNFTRSLGLVMRIGEVTALQAGSPALAAVDADGKPSPIQVKDVIKAVDGVEDFDPMRLPDVVTAKAGRKVEITLLRPGREQTEMKVYVVPQMIPTWIDFPEQDAAVDDYPMSIPSIGIAYKVLPTVRKVVAASPAATASTPLAENDVVKKIEIEFLIPELGSKEPKSERRSVEFKDLKEDAWPTFFWVLQDPRLQRVTLTIQRPKKEGLIVVSLVPMKDPTWPLWLRGMRFQPVFGVRKVDNLVTAMELGLDMTRLSILRLYLFLRGLAVTRTISPTMMSGPISIGQVAYALADSIPQLILFLGFLNINLAVINFLPIPVLDGGHMVFLIYEAIFRRRPADWWVLAANYLGLFLIGTLMLFVFGLDIYRLIVGM